MTSKIVFIYSSVPPLPSVSGAYRRVYSNVSTYNYLGYKVILFFTGSSFDFQKLSDSPLTHKGVKFIFLQKKNIDKMGFQDIFNDPIYSTLSYFFPNQNHIRSQIKKNIKEYPNSIHHFEYIQNAVAAVGLRGNFIWSNHDNVSKRTLIRSKLGRKSKSNISKLYTWVRYIKMKVMERIVLNYMELMVTISICEKHYYQRISPKKVHYIPFSIKNMNVKLVNCQNEKIKVLHLGNINAMLPFQSLNNLMKYVYPNLSNEELSKFELLIVGENSNGSRSTKLIEEFKKYSNIQLLGFVENLDSIWHKADLHIIASTEEIGIRTKIIESFMNKVPVLCMENTSKGLIGLKHLENILLPSTFPDMVSIIKKIISGKLQTNSIAQNGFVLYQKQYSLHTSVKKMESLINNVIYKNIYA